MRAGSRRPRVPAAVALLAVTLATAGAAQPPRELPATLRVMEAGGLEAEAAALIMSGQEGGQILVELLALPMPARTARSRVPVILEIDGSGLLAGQVGDLLQVEVSIYALDARNAIQDTLLKVVEINLSELRPRLAATGLKLYAELELPPGSHVLKALVRNRGNDSIGLRSAALEVTDPDRGSSLLLSPLVGEPADAWVAAVVPPDGGATPLLRPPLPAARPLLSVGDSLEMEVLSARLRSPTELLVEVHDAEGERIERQRIRLGLRSPSPFAHLDRAPAAFDTGGLAPGRYSLRLVAPDLQVASPPIPFIVVEPGVADELGVWAGLTATDAPAPTAPADDERVAGSARLQIPTAQVREEFLAALRLLAAADRQGAKAALVRMEESALAGSGAAIAPLGKVELKELKKLARKDAESLVPVLRLYESLYHDHRGAGRFLLSTHTRIMLMDLVDLYVDRSRVDDAEEIAARFLTNLAAGLQALGLDPFAVQIFREALDLSPQDEIVLLSLASAFERRGGYAEAEEYLLRLLEAHPESPEARLRLALCRARMGRAEPARELLEGLIADRTPGWIGAVAHQELVALLISEDRPERAREVVEAGLERYPNDEKLTLQDALLHDLGRRPGDAREALARRVELDDTRGPSPRLRYTLPPEERLRRLEADLEALVDARLDSLQAVVSPDQSRARRSGGGTLSP